MARDAGRKTILPSSLDQPWPVQESRTKGLANAKQMWIGLQSMVGPIPYPPALSDALDCVERTSQLLQASAERLRASKDMLRSDIEQLRTAQIALLKSRALLAGSQRVMIVRNSN